MSIFLFTLGLSLSFFLSARLKLSNLTNLSNVHSNNFHFTILPTNLLTSSQDPVVMGIFRKNKTLKRPFYPFSNFNFNFNFNFTFQHLSEDLEANQNEIKTLKDRLERRETSEQPCQCNNEKVKFCWDLDLDRLGWIDCLISGRLTFKELFIFEDYQKKAIPANQNFVFIVFLIWKPILNYFLSGSCRIRLPSVFESSTTAFEFDFRIG